MIVECKNCGVRNSLPTTGKVKDYERKTLICNKCGEPLFNKKDNEVKTEKKESKTKKNKETWHPTFSSTKGGKYVGGWKNEKYHGKGSLTLESGDTYVGNWKKSKPHGNGTFTSITGDKYVGEWSNGQYHGQGTLTLKNGDRFVGSFRNGDRNGKGIFFYSDGKKISGKWNKGTYVNQVEKLVSPKVRTRFDLNKKINWPSIRWPRRKKPQTTSQPSQKKLKFFNFKTIKLTLFSLKTFALAFIILSTIALGSMIFKISNQDLHAAITQPQLLIEKKGKNFNVIECNCERTLQHFEISEDFKKALIYTEDREFENHFGINPKSILAVIFLGRRGGGSTLEMQLVKNTVLQPKRDILRKFNEIILAVRLSRIFTKNDIIRLYSSKINFGRVDGKDIKGLRAAADVYFEKKPSSINFFEASILLAILNAPSRNDPFKNPKPLLKKANAIAERLSDKGFMTYNGISDLKKYMPTKIGPLPTRNRYIEDYVKKEFRELNPDRAEGRYRVITTIDAISQWQAQEVVKKEVDNFIGKSPESGVTRVALISIDGAGGIKAMIGGLNYQIEIYNLVEAERQPASTAKISTYLAALEAGLDKDTRVWDDRAKLKKFKKLQNYDKKYKGEIPLSQCFAESRNVCTYYLAETEVGFQKVSIMSQKLGLSKKDQKGENLVLGTIDTTLIKNTAAFASINKKGLYHKPYIIRFVTSKYGKLEYSNKVKPKRLFTAEVASQMGYLLEQVVKTGTAKSAKIHNHKTFGKTGTSQENRDAWFVGFTDHPVTTGVWVGPKEKSYMNNVTGGSLPAKIFRTFNNNLVERLAECNSNFSSISDGLSRDINCQ